MECNNPDCHCHDHMPNPRFPDAPILTRVPVGGMPTNYKYRFHPAGEFLEGFEVWLPDLIPLVQSSLIEMRAELTIDNAIIEPSMLVARYRRKAFQ